MYWKNMISLDDEEIDAFITECTPTGMICPTCPKEKIHLFLRRYESTMAIKCKQIESNHG